LTFQMLDLFLDKFYVIKALFSYQCIPLVEKSNEDIIEFGKN